MRQTSCPSPGPSSNPIHIHPPLRFLFEPPLARRRATVARSPDPRRMLRFDIDAFSLIRAFVQLDPLLCLVLCCMHGKCSALLKPISLPCAVHRVPNVCACNRQTKEDKLDEEP